MMHDEMLVESLACKSAMSETVVIHANEWRFRRSESV
jgi:hypothetical protein